MSEPKKRFALTADEKNSALWQKLLAHWETKIESFRLQNEGDKSELDTAKLRGRIAEVRSNLSLNNDLPDID